jgi:DNA-binding GntR family transcriptional regulator
VGLRQLNTVASLGSDSGSNAVSASDRVSNEILLALEQRRIVPGQRLVETELAIKVGVGRNAVREAIQRLSAKGIVDLCRNRSPSIRIFNIDETMEVLEVAEEMFGLLARIAARNLRRASHVSRLRSVLARLGECEAIHNRDSFPQIRREFYRSLLEVGGNRELHRHFATIQMQIIYAQYHSSHLTTMRLVDYRRICEAVIEKNVKSAETLGRRHVIRVRKAIMGMVPRIL